MNVRIVEKKLSDSVSEFYPEYRKYFVWKRFHRGSGVCYSEVVFSSLKKAEAFLDNVSKRETIIHKHKL